jgi:hypothetical protein
MPHAHHHLPHLNEVGPNLVAAMQSVSAGLSAIAGNDAEKYRLIKEQVEAAAGFTGEYELTADQLEGVRASFRENRAAMLKRLRAFVRTVERDIKAENAG